MGKEQMKVGGRMGWDATEMEVPITMRKGQGGISGMCLSLQEKEATHTPEEREAMHMPRGLPLWSSKRERQGALEVSE